MEYVNIGIESLEGTYTEIQRGNGHDDTAYIMFKNDDGSNVVITNDLLDVLDRDCQGSFRQWIHDWTR